MKVSGFTIARNVIKYDYPIVEAISSILPLCDEVVVAVGKSEDDTLGLIRSIPSSKIKIVETVWDDSVREGGRTFALETDKAFRAISPETTWCIYIQADEVLHEQYHATVRQAMEKFAPDPAVEGLLFNYKHFYGSYDYVGESWQWYRREIRVVRNLPTIFSYRDAQGFRKQPNDKLRVKLIDAFIYHYGWVKDPRKMQEKIAGWSKFYQTDEWISENVAAAHEFDYSSIDSLERFNGSHPAVMLDRIQRKNWKFDHDITRKRYRPREQLKRFISSLIGYRIGEYKNYKLI